MEDRAKGTHTQSLKCATSSFDQIQTSPANVPTRRPGGKSTLVVKRFLGLRKHGSLIVLCCVLIFSTLVSGHPICIVTGR